MGRWAGTVPRHYNDARTPAIWTACIFFSYLAYVCTVWEHLVERYPFYQQGHLTGLRRYT